MMNNPLQPCLPGLLRIVGPALLVSALSVPAQAVTYGFFCLSGNSATDCAAGESQLFVDVTELGPQEVTFTFYNTGPAASSITDVYFDDGSLLGISSLVDRDDGIGGDSGVDFSLGASPPNLPGANNIFPSFQVTAGFLADSDPAVQPNGVNPGEWLAVNFLLQGTQTYADVLDELSTGELRIGIRSQGFSGGGSESFVNSPVAIPVPAAAWFFGSAMLALAGLRRQQRH